MKIRTLFLILFINSLSFGDTLFQRTQKYYFDIYVNNSLNRFFPSTDLKTRNSIPAQTLFFDLTVSIQNNDSLFKEIPSECVEQGFIKPEVIRKTKCYNFIANKLKNYGIEWIIIPFNKPNKSSYCPHVLKSVEFIPIKRSPIIINSNIQAKRNDLYRCTLNSTNELLFFDFKNLKIEKITQLNNEIRRKYNQKNKDPDLVTDLMARQFIDPKNLINAKKSQKEIIDIYDPAPETWRGWSMTNAFDVLSFAKTKEEITYDFLVQTQFKSLNDVNIRKRNKNFIYGFRIDIFDQDGFTKNAAAKFLSYKYALTDREVKTLGEFKFQTSQFARLTWDSFPCTGTNNRKRNDLQCGLLRYPQNKYVKDETYRILKDVNNFLKNTHSLKESLLFATKIQREFVALHPFKDGNGRISRWILDIIAKRAGLPTIIYHDMNSDYSIEHKDLYLEAKKGILHSTLILRQCLKSKSKYCAQWSLDQF